MNNVKNISIGITSLIVIVIGIVLFSNADAQKVASTSSPGNIQNLLIYQINSSLTGSGSSTFTCRDVYPWDADTISFSFEITSCDSSSVSTRDKMIAKIYWLPVSTLGQTDSLCTLATGLPNYTIVPLVLYKSATSGVACFGSPITTIKSSQIFGRPIVILTNGYSSVLHFKGNLYMIKKWRQK
jgi:hypothetical protein